MIGDRHAKLAALIIKNTRERKISWSQMQENAFAWANEKSSIFIRQRTSRMTGIKNTIIEIQNESGQVIDSISDAELLGSKYRPPFEGDWNVLMGEAYENARRQALGVDDILDELIANLGG